MVNKGRAQIALHLLREGGSHPYRNVGRARVKDKVGEGEGITRIVTSRNVGEGPQEG